MSVEELTIIFATLVLWKPFQFLLFGVSTMPVQVHSTYDIYGNAYNEKLRKLDKLFYSRWTVPSSLTILSFLFLPWNPWPLLDPENFLFPTVILSSFSITWWCLTRTKDKERIALGFLFFFLLWHPAFLPLFLFLAVSTLRAWEHHMQLALRVLLTIFLSYFIFGLGDFISELTDMPWATSPKNISLLLVLFCVSQHYFIPGIKKLTLGKYPWSWALNNQIHQLCRSAYAYGWLRFVNEKKFLKATSTLKKFNIPLQVLVVLFELLFGVALISWELTAMLLFVAVLFHVGYLLLTGAFFWQNILLLSALFFGVLQAPSALFTPLAMGLNLLLALPLLRVWNVNKLGWWDTPFVNRIEWVATDQSGKRHLVNAEFFCPDDRVFALQKMGLHLCNDKIVTKHFGETPNEALAYTLIYAANDLKQLPKIVDTFGVDYYSPSVRSMYIQYFKEFFTNYKKDPIPKWLKAPGTELYNNFKGDEKVVLFEANFVREYITDHKVMRVYERPILKIQFCH